MKTEQKETSKDLIICKSTQITLKDKKQLLITFTFQSLEPDVKLAWYDMI